MMYTADQMRAEIERVMAAVRKQTLEDERRRVANAIWLFGHSLVDAKACEAVHELIPFLYVTPEDAMDTSGGVL